MPETPFLGRKIWDDQRQGWVFSDDTGFVGYERKAELELILAEQNEKRKMLRWFVWMSKK